MSYSNAVSKGISKNSKMQSKDGSVPGTGHTGIYPKLTPTEEDFPPLSSNSHGPINATPVAVNRPATNQASASSHHTSEPGIGHGGYAGQTGDRRSGLNLVPGERVLDNHNMMKQNNIQDRAEQRVAGLQNIGDTLVKSGPVQDCEKRQGRNDFDYGPSGHDTQTDVGPNPHPLQAAAGQQNVTSQHDNAVENNNADLQGSSVSVNVAIQQDRNLPPQAQDKTQQHNSLSKSTSKIDWKGREPPQAGNPSQDPKGYDTHGQGNTKNHGNGSKGSRGELTQTQENPAKQNFHNQTRSQSFREDQENAQRNSQQNQNAQEGNTVKECRVVSTEKSGPSHHTEKKRHNFEGGARPRERRFEEGMACGEEVYEVDPEIIEKFKDDDESKFEYFWQSYSVYSQWHKKEFTVDGKTYMCAEQFMMHRKATLFEDFKTARKIMETKDPRKQKKLGRQVENFVEEIWQEGCEAIVEEGNMAKFSQNSDLLNIICASNPKILVEASPMDKIWGIGLYSDDPRAWNRAYWLGENKLGKVLTKVRIKLMLQGELITKAEHDRQLKELMR
ncbi:uncharacterized protein LOC110459571 [Mizuhopecten yessoensis]|uniref:uncharacterized protein LOC110459571 n=1 Tax=Mizuhopecten yessoensis TaxID=6573 RepID=UPI000B45BB4C|nr:uncharacterized protein LOC110459571 [Mizuhopecten yessoensis]